MQHLLIKLTEIRKTLTDNAQHYGGQMIFTQPAAERLVDTVNELIQGLTREAQGVEKFDKFKETWDELVETSGEPVLKFFEFSHLPPMLQVVSQNFALQAFEIVTNLPKSAERAAGLRKLLEAKDCVVRCALVEMKKDSPAPRKPEPPRGADAHVVSVVLKAVERHYKGEKVDGCGGFAPSQRVLPPDRDPEDLIRIAEAIEKELPMSEPIHRGKLASDITMGELVALTNEALLF